MPSGCTYALRVLRFNGTRPGPGAYIQAGLHGAELQGTAVIYHLSRYFDAYPPTHDIVLVPQANPYANDLKIGEYTTGRTNPITGENWNRQFINLLENGMDIFSHNTEHTFRNALKAACDTFKNRRSNHSFGAYLALVLQRLAIDARCVLDLHADSVSVPYLYSPAYAINAARYLDIAHIVTTPNAFTPCFNQSCFYPWWQWASAHGQNTPFISYTIELGDKESINLAYAEMCAHSILNFLRNQKIISGIAKKPTNPCHIVPEEKFIRLYASTSGFVDYIAPLGTLYEKDALLAKLLIPHKIGSNQSDILNIYAPERGCLVTHTSSGNILEGQELLKYIALP